MTTRLPLLTAFWVTIALLPGLGCEHEHEHEGKPTEAVCPATQTLTYANFGMAFFTKYCQTCHASTVTGDARHDAPVDHTFDQIEDIRLLTEHIDEHAGAGPAAVNTIMPPAGTTPLPTEAERRQLSEWLACGAPLGAP